jgi:TatD DNase family protein
LHSFSGSTIDADRAAKLNLVIGITGPVTFRKAVQLQQVVANVPVTHLLIETDAPFLTPHPYRGQRNEPAYVRYVAEKIAQIKDYTYEEICEVTTNNAGRLFHW